MRPSARGAVHHETRHITEAELDADPDPIDAACRSIASDLGAEFWEILYSVVPWVGGGLVIRGRLWT